MKPNIPDKQSRTGDRQGDVYIRHLMIGEIQGAIRDAVTCLLYEVVWLFCNCEIMCLSLILLPHINATVLMSEEVDL